jgi:hypothetical protein
VIGCTGSTRQRAIAACTFCLWLVSAFAQAQERIQEQAPAPAALAGIVHDQTGRVVPDAHVVLEDDDGNRWETWVSPIGYWEVELPPGTYRVEITYRELTFTGTAVAEPNWIMAFDTVLQFRMQDRVAVAGEMASSATPMVAALRAHFSHEALEGLVLLNGRTLQALFPFVPGILVTDATGTLAQFTSAGQRRFANRLSIDGVSADLAIDVRGSGIGEAGSRALPAVATSGGTQTLVPFSAIEGIDIRTTNTQAEGRAPGALMSIVTRAGTDMLHGGASFDARPAALGAADWFHAASATKLQSSSTDGGVSFGGPLVARRAFFFGAWEGQRIDRPVEAAAQVPSAALRASAPASLQPLLAAWPLPNGPDGSAGLAALTQQFLVASFLSSASLRLDVNAGRHRFFARANTGTSHGDAVGAGFHLPDFAFTQTERTSTQTLTAGMSSLLSAVAFNDLRANASRNVGALDADAASRLGAKALPEDGLVAAPADAWLRLNLFTGPGGVLQRGRTGGASQRQFEVTDTLSYLHGRHELRFGLDLARVVAGTPASARVTYSFTNALQLTQGRARQVLIEDVAASRALFTSGALYAQDTWRMSPRLTLAYGLRYSVSPAPDSRTALEPVILDVAALPAVQPRGGPLWRTSWSDLAPEVGISWQVSPRATLHAGWDLVYDDLSSPGAAAFGRGVPFVSRRILGATAFPVPDLSAAAAFHDGDEYYAFPQDLKRPRTYRWNVGLDHEAGPSQRVSVAYVGAAGRDLVYWSGYFAGERFTAPIDVYTNSASSDYQALYAAFTRRLTRGLQAQVAYTWSHAIDTDSGEPEAPHLPLSFEPVANERASADYDRRHVLRASLSADVPSPRSGPWRSLLRDWRVDLVGLLQSGAPFSVTAQQDLGFGRYTVRPDPVPGAPLWIADSESPGGRRLNEAAFALAGTARQGMLGRNTLQAMPLRQLDAALTRTLRFSRFSVQARVEAFNVLNVPNFGRPVAALQVGGFGRPLESYAEALGTGTLTQGGLAPVQQAGAPRSVQLALRLAW